MVSDLSNDLEALEVDNSDFDEVLNEPETPLLMTKNQCNKFVNLLLKFHTIY